MPDNDVPQKVARAAPTKRFFIAVLVKDIYLLDALVELVDNSVDSARTRFPDQLKDVIIDIEFSAERFSIRDNAAGIPISVAENYAFRFGRADNAPASPKSVGEFGVGMKRALFKLGNNFTVTSRTATEQFSIVVNVEEWENLPEEDPNGWNFPFASSGVNDGLQSGTDIEVTGLYPYTLEEFASANFGTRLIEALTQSHAESLTDGLQITVNRQPLVGSAALLSSSAEITPISRSWDLTINGKTVNVRLHAGIGPAKLVDAGWYVYCNGRQIERAEKTAKTGWNTALGEDQTPKSHWQFRRFRGFVFFESDSPDVLPWNTTKTGLDIEAAAYRQVRPDMFAALKQVVEFLNALDNETNDPGPLTASVNQAPQVSLMSLPASGAFIYTAQPTQDVARRARISYTVDSDLAEAVRERLTARNNKEVGELTFKYFVDSEGLDG
jgi:Histidine kinase-, DNA gyrase B-, and HSP90-like ATPase